ncbi:DUF2793 domain-containing protein [Cochlodiniinecator piscidefendens]|uniref:DUF2793 domain-containing protein n=1 Tax=Cochlodiniinecator piscidefendens TaxID=2715756 RepID=UPI00140C25A7|nr:DUF2793 domain-containing protein [Cochlodiniinecator piscidefendens]
MPDVSANLSLPFIQPSQAQKHVTHNEALQKLDALVQLSVLSSTLANPPVVASEGDAYIIPTGGTGVWAGSDGALAIFEGNVWTIIQPEDGWLAYVQDEDLLYRYLGDWAVLPLSQTAAMLGVNGTPDAYNKFLCQSEGVLFNHVGSHQRTTINKASPTDDASHNFQTGFSSRALSGLLGSDNYSIKVSPDGASYKTALQIDASTGIVSKPHCVAFQATAGAIPAGTAGAFKAGYDGASAQVVLDPHGAVASGVFTAPVDGVYQITGSASTGTGTTHNLTIGVYKNSALVGKFSLNYFKTFSDVSKTVFLELVLGDTVYCELEYQNNVTSSVYSSSFGGVLIG